MEYELKPAVIKDGVKYKVIRITDIALHTAKKTPTPLVGKKIQKAFEDNKPDRIYSHFDDNAVLDDRTLVISLIKNDPDLIRMIKEEEAKGYKVLIGLPKEGVPVVFGKDTVEFINSKNGKRILRGIAKKKEEK
ncbi:MAG: hypothetical protein PHG66_04105 [Candidatus Colwellbacteria bacterium]|nr:hypothetical protein [Candidatus Colwellbacteria bacterium]